MARPDRPPIAAHVLVQVARTPGVDREKCARPQNENCWMCCWLLRDLIGRTTCARPISQGWCGRRRNRRAFVPRPAHNSNAAMQHFHPRPIRPSNHPSKPDISPDERWRIPMKTMILAAFAALSLAACSGPTVNGASDTAQLLARRTACGDANGSLRQHREQPWRALRRRTTAATDA